ncbi:MAG: S26 family signal peptidase [Planctomycetota bacterium]
MAAPSPPPPISTPRTTDETLRETFEAIVIALILAFIFRAYVIEAFVIPTGSMAPTLLGKHVAVGCEQCGYEFTADQSGRSHTGRDPLVLPCPMCHYPQEVPATTPTRSGDRLLVQKYVYSLAEPRRWDVVVFRNPQALNDNGTPGPKTNYIKRLVGLPNEALQIIDGNVYVRPLDGPRDGWEIARKTDPKANRHWQRIQRAVWQPVYHSQYVPLDHGRSERRPLPWSSPWKAAAAEQGRWEIHSEARGWHRAYRWTPAADPGSESDAHENAAPRGELRFDWVGYHGRGTWYPYNVTVLQDGVVGRQPIEDVRLAATVVPETPGVAVELETTTRFDAQAERVVARFDALGNMTLRRISPTETQTLGSVRGAVKWAVGQAEAIELWSVDQELLVWVNGCVVWRRAFDWPESVIVGRPAPLDRPEVSLRVVGGGATLHAVELDRDLAYTPTLSSSLENAPYGVSRRAATGDLLRSPPIVIRPGRYFVLGDNSPISSDGRFWNDIEPWIRKRMLPEAEAWRLSDIPDAERNYAQVVPRGLMIGRAFFIYLPAPYAVQPRGRQIVPNFGEMRLIH